MQDIFSGSRPRYTQQQKPVGCTVCESGQLVREQAEKVWNTQNLN